MDPSGSRLAWATYLGVSTSLDVSMEAPVDVDAEGHAWVAVPYAGPTGRDTLLVKLSPDATTYGYSTLIADAFPRDIKVCEDGELFMLGSTESERFFTTPGAFQRSSGTYGWEIGDRAVAGTRDAFLLRMSADGSAILRSTYHGGEADDTPYALALDDAENPIAAGVTRSLAFPVREPVQSAFRQGTGWVSKFDAGLSSLRSSTHAGDTRPFQIRGVAAGAGNEVIFAGHTLEVIPESIPEQNESGGSSDVFLVKLTHSHRDNGLRLDSVANAASHLAGPLAPGEIVEAKGSGFGEDSELRIGGEAALTLHVSENRIVAALPDDVDRTGAAQVSVVSAGRESNKIVMPTSAGAPGIFTVDGSGNGQAVILNDDGTLNSESNRAAPGSNVTIATTGMGRTILEYGQVWAETSKNVFIGGWWTPVVGGEVRALPGLPGEVHLLRVPVPDPHPAHAPEFKIPERVAVNIESGGQMSQPGVAIHLTKR